MICSTTDDHTRVSATKRPRDQARKAVYLSHSLFLTIDDDQVIPCMHCQKCRCADRWTAPDISIDDKNGLVEEIG